MWNQCNPPNITTLPKNWPPLFTSSLPNHSNRAICAEVAAYVDGEIGVVRVRLTADEWKWAVWCTHCRLL